jgi:tetraacyldisaccharide 4'-kinase
MVSEAPPFWWKKADWRALALWPFSLAYGAVARRRLVNAPREKIDVPVLCVGNLTVGGSGKTPVAIALAKRARAMGLVPGILSRGQDGIALPTALWVLLIFLLLSLATAVVATTALSQARPFRT